MAGIVAPQIGYLAADPSQRQVLFNRRTHQAIEFADGDYRRARGGDRAFFE